MNLTTLNNYIAVGDIHGRYDLLELLLGKVAMYLMGLDPMPSFRFVFLGDFVDRGPDSFLVVERIKSLCEENNAIALLGNHDEMMLNYHQKRIVDKNNIWLFNGGHKTIRSYERSMKMYGMGQWFQAFEKSGHAKFLRSLPYYHETDRAWFSHAPIPNADTMRWLPLVSHIRVGEGDFRANKDLLTWTFVSDAEKKEGSWEHDHGKLAVCGHVHRLFDRPPLLTPRIHPQIIYADTGCGCAPFAPLTAIIIEDGRYKDYIQAHPNEIVEKEMVA